MIKLAPRDLPTDALDRAILREALMHHVAKKRATLRHLKGDTDRSREHRDRVEMEVARLLELLARIGEG